jgi:hypothetical protein
LNTQRKSSNQPTLNWRSAKSVKPIAYANAKDCWQFGCCNYLTLLNMTICLMPIAVSLSFIHSSLIQCYFVFYSLTLWWSLIIRRPAAKLALHFSHQQQLFFVNGQLAEFKLVNESLLGLKLKTNSRQHYWLTEEALIDSDKNAWRALQLRIRASQGQLL